MRCAWQAFLNLLPLRMRQAVDMHGKNTLQELRLRLGLAAELIRSDGPKRIEEEVIIDDLRFVINAASRYSPWTAETTARGYITAPGGHRIGLCGQAVVSNGCMSGIREPTSLCIRVARDFAGLSCDVAVLKGSILIIGKPGSGKTTFLRDLIRERSERNLGSIAVVDEREEIFPVWNNTPCFFQGTRTDVLRGCPKAQGIDIVLRSMGPETIAVDEITESEDCQALLQAGWCGVNLLATAHAGDLQDLMSRPVYRPIVRNRLFDTVVVLQQDRSWKVERMES